MKLALSIGLTLVGLSAMAQPLAIASLQEPVSRWHLLLPMGQRLNMLIT